MASQSTAESKETEREIELRLAKVVITDELVHEMAKMAKEEKIRERVQYMFKHWYSCGKRSKAKFNIRVQFVKNMKHFVIFMERCIKYVESRDRKMVRCLKQRVPAFNASFYWCYIMYPYNLAQSIFDSEDVRWVRKRLRVSPRTVKIGFECEEYNSPFTSGDEDSEPAWWHDWHFEDDDENDKDCAKSS